MTVKQIVNAAFRRVPPAASVPAPGADDRPPANLRLQELTPEELQETVNQAYADEASAQFVLGRLLFRGLGVEPDPVEAFKWLSLASRHGDASSAQLCGIVIQALTPEQISEGRRRIAEFLSQRGESATAPDSVGEPVETVTRHPSTGAKSLVEP